MQIESERYIQLSAVKKHSRISLRGRGVFSQIQKQYQNLYDIWREGCFLSGLWTRKDKLDETSIKHTCDGWLINGVYWNSEFARAIAPVEYQLIMAERLRRIASHNTREYEKQKILEEATLLESSAVRDAACEMKWGARKRNG